MLRAALIFLIFVGVAASMLPGGEGRGSADGSEPGPTLLVDEPGQANSSLASLDAVGGGLTLQRQWDGHFYADAQINGTTIHMLVDTGASGIALTRDDARKAGIGISIGMPNVVGSGAGGDVKGEYVTIDRIGLGNETAQGIPAVVLDGGEKSLLGQSFLKQFASVEMRGDTMVLR